MDDLIAYRLWLSLVNGAFLALLASLVGLKAFERRWWLFAIALAVWVPAFGELMHR